MPKKPTARKDHNKVPRAPRDLRPAETREAERVAKVIARVGLGSRREVEEWILAGRVAINGEVLDTPARTVTPEDRIEVDGVPLPAKERTRLFLYHKPKGVVTTNYDPEGRPTLFEILPGGLPRLVSVGRLDLNTEGLILLTNDGGLSRVLELPDTGWLRRYRVRAKGEITQDKLDALIKGITVDGVHYGPIEAMLDRVQGANVWLTLALREGKNREVRNVLGSLGLDVNRLIRLSYGPFQLGEIAQGAVEEVRTRVLSDQLGPELSAAAGADFDGPLFVHDEATEEEAARPTKGKGTGKATGKASTKGASAKTPRYAKAEGAEDRHRRRPIDLEEGPERSVTSGVVADRKGRKVLVQRVRSTETVSEEERPVRPMREREIQEAEREARRARPVREPRAPGRGAPGGERTFRKRPDDERGGRRERPEGERGERPFRERAPRPEGERSERPSRARSEGERSFRPREDGDRPARRERPEGDRPFRERAPRAEGGRSSRDGDSRPPRRERPEGERSERPARARSEGERSFRPREEGDRPFRERAPRPEGGRFSRDGDSRPPRRERPEGERSERPFRERAPRPEGERSERPFRNRSETGEHRSERPARRERPEGDRPPRRERPEGGRSFRGEGTDRPYSGRVKSEGSFRERPAGGRSFGKPGGRPPRDTEDGEQRSERRPARSFGDKPQRGKPGASRPEGERSGGKPGGRPFGGKPGGGRSGGGKPGGKPFGGKPGGRPSGGGPRGRTPRD